MIPWFELPALHLGPVTLQFFGVFAAAGVFLAVRMAARAAAARGLDPRVVVDYSVWGVASGIFFGHLFHLVAYHPEELRDPKRVLQFWEGLSSMGGLAGGVLAAVAYFRAKGVRLSDYADSFAVGMAPGWAVARLGCFAVHDHPGVLTRFPLAVEFPGGPRHDLGLYDALVLLALSFLLWTLWRRRRLEGRLLAVLALGYGVSRFLLDFLRARDLPYVDARYLGLTPAQYTSVLLVAWALYRLAFRPHPGGGQGRGDGAAGEPGP
ncbi:MAG TPA: prolipoprotein diacylglyceryl transferase family protein [Anaeromyxobacteraceae bacterium]|nr:prolipoprotein diacylglyceryl transferase family protein [Anaeromyxobacteraceae bacterium]